LWGVACGTVGVEEAVDDLEAGALLGGRGLSDSVEPLKGGALRGLDHARCNL